MHSRGARLARGWAVGAFATALAALSHAVAGGGTPSGLALVVGVVFGGMLGTLAVGRRPSLPRLAIAVGGSQLAFHALFSLLGTSGSAGAATTHSHGVALTIAASPTAHVEGPAMWMAHAVAGVITLAVLQGAERAAWRLLTEFARLIVAPLRAAVVAPVEVRPGRAPLASTSPVRLTSRLLDPAVSRRGPPLSVAF